MISQVAPKRLSKTDLMVPVLLIALSLLPMVGGVMRLLSLSMPVTPESERFVRERIPILIHVLCSLPYCIVGALQFSRDLRLRFPTFHRVIGRVLAILGALSGATGVWMTMTYEIPSGQQGPILYATRVLVGLSMVACIAVAWLSILRRQVSRHKAYMIRAYALGQGAGTQVLTLLPWMTLTGQAGGLTRDLLMTLAWLINIAVAEWIIQRVRP